MQAKFPKDEQEVNAFGAMLGAARFDRYLRACNGDKSAAVGLYMWDTNLAQAFYLSIQLWEICLRNQMDRFLRWKGGGAWPYNDRTFVSQLRMPQKTRLLEVRERQARDRGVPQASTDAIAADMSAGFWVALLAPSYSIQMAWRYNLLKVFPHAPREWHKPIPVDWDASVPHALCEAVLTLRNRVAHHEPIFDKDLNELHNKMAVLIGAMCPASHSYLISHCTVQEVLERRP